KELGRNVPVLVDILQLCFLYVARKCKSVDLVFIIDSSRSVRPHEFETMRKFMIDIINTLDVGANATRVGVVQYSSQVQNVFSLKSFSKKQDMVKAINQIIPLAQGTMTGLAIQYAMTVAFSRGEGARPGIPDVAVIVTDGRPQDRVAEVAAAARNRGVEIFAVGVARADMTSLRAMASPPLETHVFLVESFDLIHKFGMQLQGTICEDDLCNTVEHGCQHRCVSTPGSYFCVCPEDQQLQEDGKSCGTCRSANIDLVLLIDGSKSVRPQNFELVKKFVNQVVDSLDVSAHGTRVGLVQYSSRVRTEFPLSRYQAAEDIKNAVMKVEYMEKGTMTGLALKHMVENSFTEAEGARAASRNIPRVGLVFTDGRSQDSIAEWAKKAKDAGVTMYAVGVGKAVEDELREIASEPVDKHFFYSTDFTAINQIAENLKLNVCAEESQGEVEVKDPCACDSQVDFQQATMTALEQLGQKHILCLSTPGEKRHPVYSI
uniref:Matrilin 4 n=1 Tax=Scleropages formosus TaxID=113540 RepID=A0A8C9VS80_SCLFO